MPNTSSSGGVLLPAPPNPPDDTALDAIFQSLVTNVTGLPSDMVRPRWQPTTPKQPEPSINWCAIGIISAAPDDGPWISYDPAHNVGPLFRHEQLEVLSSFYGPNSKTFAALLRDGLSVPQNCEVLLASLIRFVSSDVIRAAPEFINQQWVKRQDMMLTFRRKIERTYLINSLLIADVHLIDDTTVNDTILVPPGSPIQP